LEKENSIDMSNETIYFDSQGYQHSASNIECDGLAGNGPSHVGSCGDGLSHVHLLKDARLCQ
jgi:hypothetical protein